MQRGPAEADHSQEDPNGKAETGVFQANDLRRGLKNIVRPKVARGFSHNTLYGAAWKVASQQCLGDISNHFWNVAGVTSSTITMLLKYRFGQLWNMKIAFRQQRPYLPGLGLPRSALCPHCKQPDSGGHILGGCKLPPFNAMYIKRHDSALRIVLKAIMKGAHGGFYTIADIGRDELTKDLGVNNKRIPTWLLPDSTLEAAGIQAVHRHKVRPDILLVEMSHQESTRYRSNLPLLPELNTTVTHPRMPNTRGAPTERPRKIWIIEGGYTSDTRRPEKAEEKQLQHQQLMHALRLRGYHAQLMTFVFGFGGSIYQQTLKDLEELGVDSTTCKALLKQIHLHSVEVAAKIIVQRRVLDSQKLLSSATRPP